LEAWLGGSALHVVASMPRLSRDPPRRLPPSLVGGLPRAVVTGAPVIVDEGIKPGALLKGGAHPRADRVHKGPDIRIGRHLPRELERHVDLGKHLAKRANLSGEISHDRSRTPVGPRGRARGYGVPVAAVYLADRGCFVVGFVEVRTDPVQITR